MKRDNLQGTILPYSQYKNDADIKSFTPTQSDLELVEDIMEKYLKNYPKGVFERYDQDIPKILERLLEYKRQYIAFIDKKGNKNIHINFLLGEEFPNWQTQFVHINDGGYSFFNATVNLQQKKVTDFFINGYA